MWREMSEEASTSKSSTKHPRNNHTFVDLVAGDRSAPHRVGMAEGHVLGFGLEEFLEGILANGILEELEVVREVIGVAVGSHVGKTVPTSSLSMLALVVLASYSNKTINVEE